MNTKKRKLFSYPHVVMCILGAVAVCNIMKMTIMAEDLSSSEISSVTEASETTTSMNVSVEVPSGSSGKSSITSMNSNTLTPYDAIDISLAPISDGNYATLNLNVYTDSEEAIWLYFKDINSGIIYSTVKEDYSKSKDKDESISLSYVLPYGNYQIVSTLGNGSITTNNTDNSIYAFCTTTTVSLINTTTTDYPSEIIISRDKDYISEHIQNIFTYQQYIEEQKELIRVTYASSGIDVSDAQIESELSDMLKADGILKKEQSLYAQNQDDKIDNAKETEKTQSTTSNKNNIFENVTSKTDSSSNYKEDEWPTNENGESLSENELESAKQDNDGSLISIVSLEDESTTSSSATSASSKNGFANFVFGTVVVILLTGITVIIYKLYVSKQFRES